MWGRGYNQARQRMKLKVAVVGAGAAGLCCARHLSRYKKYFQFRVLEQGKEVGGTWLYSELPSGECGNSVHSSMYKNLRVNLCKEIMFFPGFPFPSDLPSFPYHYDVLKYLQDFTRHYSLDQFISFQTCVDEIKPVLVCDCDNVHENERTDIPTQLDGINFQNWGSFRNNVRWRVTSKDVESGRRTSEDYDAVLICSGHFSEPHVPDIPGLSQFPGHVIHSHVYREPEAFKDQNVLVVGVGQSGQDICLDLSPHAKQVHVCNRGTPIQSLLPDNVEEVPGIAKVSTDTRTVYFTDGKERCVDSIILATGYIYSFPFLTEDCEIKIKKGKRVTPLYQHTFNSLHPSMAFIGMNFGYLPFHYCHYQVQWVLSVWAGQATLPSTECMIRHEEEVYQERLQQGMQPHIAGHYLGSAQWDMIELMATLGGSEPLAPVIKMLYEEISRMRKYRLMEYKAINYTVLDKDKWALKSK